MDKKRKQLVIAISASMIAALIGIAAYYWYNNAYYVSTEDARVTADMVKISPRMGGRLVEFDVSEGDVLARDQIIGRIEGGGLEGAGLEQALIRAPLGGVVVKKAGNIGEYESAGQTLALMIDPSRLYITANIEENQLSRVRTGQAVDITVDQFQGDSYTGKVRYVGQAANSAFSLLPASTSGTFTKVVQRVPVYIEFDQGVEGLLPGTNAVVRIHVGE